MLQTNRSGGGIRICSTAVLQNSFEIFVILFYATLYLFSTTPHATVPLCSPPSLQENLPWSENLRKHQNQYLEPAFGLSVVVCSMAAISSGERDAAVPGGIGLKPPPTFWGFEASVRISNK